MSNIKEQGSEEGKEDKLNQHDPLGKFGQSGLFTFRLVPPAPAKQCSPHNSSPNINTSNIPSRERKQRWEGYLTHLAVLGKH